MTVAQAMEIAATHHNEGRLAEAEQIYRAVLAQMPDNAHALHYLGLINISRGNKQEGLKLIRQSLELAPSVGMFHMNHAGALLDTGDAHGAEQAAREAIAKGTPGAQPYINLGQALWRQNRFDEALAAMQKADELDPQRPDVHSFLGVYNLGLRHFDVAIPALRRAVELEPTRAFHYANLGAALYAIRELSESEAMYRQAVALQPDRPDYHADMALPMMAAGNWTEGLRESEWRFQVARQGVQQRNFAQPRWDGSPLQGKTIFIYSEQGFGDSILFGRYVPLLAQNGATVILETPPELLALFQSLKGVEQLVPAGQAPPKFDVYSSIVSLPLHFGTTPTNVPADIPYLSADSARIDRWRNEILAHAHGSELRVGLVWGGSKTARHDAQRSLTLGDFSHLAQIPDVRWYSLQFGPDAQQLAQPTHGMQIVDLGQKNDFADSAAAMASLDLVICVDTSAAHVAGATGRPVWMLEPFLPYWPWGIEGNTTPWYPTMRIFRQPALDNWDGVMTSVAEALRQRAGE